MIFDGDCGFCRRSVRRLQAWVGSAVHVEPFQERDFEAHPEPTRDQCASAVHLVEADGTVRQGADACFRAVSYGPGRGAVHGIWRAIPGLPWVSERVYRVVAGRRVLISAWNRRLSGTEMEPPRFAQARRFFLAALGLVFLIAFVSLQRQASSLFGSDGILPLELMLAWDELSFDPLAMPTVFWLGQGDTMMQLVLIVGMLGALLLVLGVFPFASLLAAFLSYLSFNSLANPPGPSLGNVFFDYEWDRLLLEAGFLGLFVAPWRAGWHRAPSAIGSFLLRLLIVRAVFLPGLVKWTGGDPAWADGSGWGLLGWTQPIPPPGGLLLEDLPLALFWVVAVLELIAPWCLLGPRRVRAFGVVAVLSLQLFELCAFNFGWRPLVVGALCFMAIEDRWLRRAEPEGEGESQPAPLGYARVALGATLVVLSLVTSVRWVAGDPNRTAVERAAQAFGVCHGYAKIPFVMTSRPGFVIEGRDADGNVFRMNPRYGVGDLARTPGTLPHHMPRLDWKLAGAAAQATGGAIDRWFGVFMARVLSQDTTARLALSCPEFEETAPAAVRVWVRPFVPAAADDETLLWYQRPAAEMPPWYVIRDGQLTVE